jgi:HD-like signal output (HDOD) protein
MDNLADVIEKDAVISVRLIHVANSVLYRGAEKILTVRQAIPRKRCKGDTEHCCNYSQ